MAQNSSDSHKTKGHKHSQDLVTFPLYISHYISICSFPSARSRNLRDWIFKTREDYVILHCLHRILLIWLNYYHNLSLKITHTHTLKSKAAVTSNSRDDAFIPHHVTFKSNWIIVILCMFPGRSTFEIAHWSNT